MNKMRNEYKEKKRKINDKTKTIDSVQMMPQNIYLYINMHIS